MPFVKQHSTAELLKQEQNKAKRRPDGALLEGVDAEEGDESGLVANGQGYDDPRQQAAMETMNNVPQTQRKLPPTDLVMVFPYKTDSRVKYGEAAAEEDYRGLHQPKEWEKEKMQQWQVTRNTTCHALSDSGLVMMLYYSRDRDEVFVRIAADPLHLRQVAEMTRYKLELKPQYLSAYAEYKNDYPGRRELNYSDRCVVSHLYLNHTDKQGHYPQRDAIFRPVDRIRLVDHIIRSNDHNCAGVDVGQLLHSSDILHYFPLHDQSALDEMDKSWFQTFVNAKNIDKVRDYFGERIALYFLFMSHLCKWLVLPSLAGVALCVVELFAQTPDNFTSFSLCIGLGIWSTLVIHFWRRKSNKYLLKWGTFALKPSPEPTRPEFYGVSRINPVTSRVDRFYPWSERIWKVLFSYSVIIVTLVVLFFEVAVLMLLRHEMAPNRIPFQIINALVVELANFLFTKLATWLTERENHRSYQEHSTHLLAKTVVFKFINCYSSLYYIAFFKANSTLFGQPMKCVDDDCLKDLGSQLAIFMIMRLTLQNMLELLGPWAIMQYRAFMEGIAFKTSIFSNPATSMPDLSRPEREAKREEYDVYQDMDEVLILYGYTVLFVVACPWVPLLALISLILECFLDQKKLVLLFQRPYPSTAMNNEPWDTCFDVISLIAMVTNGALIVFSSHTFDGWSHTGKILLFLAMEHAMILLRLLVSTIFPAIPWEVRLLAMQQQVIVHRHLNLGGEEDDHETRASAMMATPQPPPHVFDQDEEEDW
eukprot:CAMPEP_0197619362 /NCGR_PEP_ID=MMETSP1338-20131121/386_1 /TAXON_ID=43686 ORGANISM="Pelagodinium beii, Strain RCC1491" /NCGR_SAMPLE_ID=MMETSP1338 /ASSEMBLY_ACC=CAM_ASM_000754 /LENGTH=761 /DNA_ID=CAMNT_0043188315 /DNA_START=74 /DNA_END=2356 /DNA_ORIENTATION=-